MRTSIVLAERDGTKLKISGAQILLRSLKAEGVDTIFGYPGGAVIDIFDTLVREFSEDFKFILVRHEQAAVHAADGYAAKLPDAQESA